MTSRDLFDKAIQLEANFKNQLVQSIFDYVNEFTGKTINIDNVCKDYKVYKRLYINEGNLMVHYQFNFDNMVRPVKDLSLEDIKIIINILYKK